MKPNLFSFLLAAGALGAGVYATFKEDHGELSGPRRRRGLRGPAEAHELQLFCENDGDLHRRQGSYIEKALITRMAKGTYDHELSKKAWGYLVESCARKYAQEFGGVWNQLFSPADRREVSAKFADHFLAEAKLGNYDHLLPKKYKKKTLHGWG